MIVIYSLSAAAASTPNWADVSTLVTSSLTAVAALVISVVVARSEGERVRRIDRQALRSTLRDWFQTLSTSATDDVKSARGRLRSEIEEISDAQGFSEIFDLMTWAVDMLDQSRARSASGEISPEEAHLRRIVVKRRFRQFVARWVVSRRVGTHLIASYCSRGWSAISAESPDAADTARYLAPL